MSKNFRFSLLIITLAVITIASLDWQIPSFSESDEEQKQIVSLYIQQAKSLNFDKNGELHSTLSSPAIKQYQHDQSLQVTDPALRLLHNQQQWQLNAQQAIMDEKAQTIELKTDIRIQQANGNLITTDYLLIDNQRKQAETDQSVLLVSELGQTQATGLIADFEQQTLILKNRVSSRYVPKAKP